MSLCSLVLSGLLLGQFPNYSAPTPSPIPTGAAAPATRIVRPGAPDRRSITPAPLTPVERPPATSAAPATQPPSKFAAAELIAAALAARRGGALAGQPLTLAAGLSATADRRQQLDTAHAYWKLVRTLTSYNYALDHHQQLEKLESRGEGAFLLRTARASSTAALKEAEVAAVSAQHDLATLAMLAANAPLPLPADRPYVGPYRTSFQELFANRPAPPRAKLVDQTLPLLRQAIDVRASAVEAASEAQSAAMEAYQAGRASLATALSCLVDLQREQTALVDLVCQYNDQIADYALSLSGISVTGPAVVGMLIPTAHDPIRPLTYEDEGTAGRLPAQSSAAPRVGPTVAQPSGTSQEPQPTFVPAPAVSASATPASPDTDRSAITQTIIPNREPMPASRQGDAEASRRAVLPTSDTPTLVPATEKASAPAPAESSPSRPGGSRLRRAEPVVPLEPVPPQATSRTTNRPAAEASATPAPQSLYWKLVGAAPAVQATELAQTLQGNRAAPEGTIAAIGLEECLRGRSAADRRAVIDAYWLAWQRGAEYQVLVRQRDVLQGIVAETPPRAGSGAADLPQRLRASQRAAEAAVLEGRAALADAQSQLAERLGVASSTWPLPRAIPYAGPYLLKLDALPPSVTSSIAVRRLAARIPLLADALGQRAAAVVEADSARATLVARGGDTPVDQVLTAANRQTDETLAFLKSLTDYNRAIGQYALAVLPPDIPSETLIRALIREK